MLWTWSPAAATVTGMTSAYDSTYDAEVVTVTGSGFTAGDLEGTELFINDVK